MSKGLIRILIGVLCAAYAFYSIFSSKQETDAILYVLGAYGLFSIGLGIYFIQREKGR
jgi:hypothetical protein